MSDTEAQDAALDGDAPEGTDQDPASPPPARTLDRGGIPDDDEDYGARVRRRINKITGTLRSTEAQLAEERAARVRAERALHDQRRQTVNYAGSAAEQSVAAAREQLRSARASGDFDGEMQAQEALTAALTAKGQVDTAKRQVESAPAIPDPQPIRSAPSRPEALEDWISRNDWFGEHGDPDMTASAVSISNKLLARGIPANSPEYFAEVDRRMKAAFPDSFEERAPRRQAQADPEDDGVRSPPPPAAAPARGAAPVRPTQPRQQTARNIALTDEMKAVAKSLGVSEADYATQMLAAVKAGKMRNPFKD